MELSERKNIRISNAFFNLALEYAEQNNLYYSAILLKKSILFDKKNIDSRNLLGLIYYTEGEIVDALIQWVVSNNIVKNNNLATYFIDCVQNDPNYNQLKDSIKYYNAAIDDINQERNDLAMMHLNKAIELNPQYVKALTLLALLQLQIKENIKAGSNLYLAQKIDNGNFVINKLMNYALKVTNKKEIRDKKLSNLYSKKKIEEDDAIIPNKYIKISTSQKIIFSLIGVFVGFLCYHKIVLPMIRISYESNSTSQIITYADRLNDLNKEINDLTKEKNELQNNYDYVNTRLQNYEEQNKNFTFRFETLNSVISLFDQGQIAEAARLYISIENKEQITDETLVALLNAARSRIEGLGSEKLTNLGTDSWNANNKDQAISYYTLSLNLDPDNPETMFLLARLYQSLNRIEEANSLFDKVIAEHPDSNYARRSKEARGY